MVQILHQHGIGVLGCFVLGFDDDTPENLGQTVETVATLKIDLPRYAVLTPFPGTNLFAKLKKEGRILTEDWSWYDTERVVFQPNHMSPQDLQQILYHTWRKSYQLGRIAGRVKWARKNRWLALLLNLGLRHYGYRLGNDHFS